MRDRSTWLELSQPALRQNLRFLRRELGPDPVFSSVVKGNAYGHSISHFVPMAEECGVRHFSVFNSEEAQQVVAARKHDSNVVIMGSIPPDTLEWVIENDVAFFAFDLARLDAALRIATRIGRPARVHLEVETGLYRTGLTAQTFAAALRRALKHPDKIRIEGVCTHFAGAETFANYHRIQQQIHKFEERSRELANAGFPEAARHVACSAAIFNYPECRHDLVRVGIAQYGFWPSEETFMFYARRYPARARKSPLRRVLCWKSRVMTVKRAPAGAFIGYGNSYLAQRRTLIAVVPVGYYHGFARNLSNLGNVLIRGRRCSVLGTVNMNAISVDVTDNPGVETGDEVVLLGMQGDQEITVGAFGESTHTLNYEVLVRLPSDLPRVVIR